MLDAYLILGEDMMDCINNWPVAGLPAQLMMCSTDDVLLERTIENFISLYLMHNATGMPSSSITIYR